VFLDLRGDHGIEANFSLLDAASAANLKCLFLSYENIGFLKGIDVFADSLTTLYVSVCSLWGTFPEGMLQLTSLNNLDMSYNAISGVIPDGIDSLTDLRILGLSHDFFSGQIPSTIGNLTRLSNFQLQFNILSGTLPSALGDLLSLTFLSADDQIRGGGNLQVGGITGPRSTLPTFNFCSIFYPTIFSTVPYLLRSLLL
jgi:Leucine rich repeat